MNQFPPKPVREFLKDVERASNKDKKSVTLSLKKARDMAQALEGTFSTTQISQG